MRDIFRKIFNPSIKETQELYDTVNVILRQNLEKYGKCCASCRHSVYVQENSYHDFLSCHFDKSLMFSYGIGAEKHICEKYEVIEPLKVEVQP